MRRQAIIGAFLAAGGLSAPTAAPAQEPEVVQLERGPDRLIRIMMDRRARLGIKVNLQPRETDSIGAYVDAVTPSGPAAQAGIRSGDIITKLDGKSVLSGGAAEDDQRGARESLPGLRLIELAARLEPNDTVAVEYRRGKDRRTASVVTSAEPEMAYGYGGVRPGARLMGPDRMGPGPLPAGDFMERFEMAGPHWQYLQRVAPGPAGAGTPQPRSGPLLRCPGGGAGHQRPQGLDPGPPGGRRGADGGRARPLQPVAPPPHLAELRVRRNLQAGHPAEPQAGDAHRPPGQARRMTLATPCAPAHRCPCRDAAISSAHPWRELWESCGP